MTHLLFVVPAVPLTVPLLFASSGIGVFAAAIALGIRHGIDWDHIAAITDITSTTATAQADNEWLMQEPGVLLTDESHHDHSLAIPAEVARSTAIPAAVTQRREHQVARLISLSAVPVAIGARGASTLGQPRNSGLPSSEVGRFVRRQWPSVVLGSMYALGHGSVVFVLGALAILANKFLPRWIDPIMERVVGFTLLFLAAYLFYSLYRYFHDGEEFRMRSRWMLVFAGIRNGWDALRERLLGTPRQHVHGARQCGIKTAYGIGMIHGVGAETGTQVLVITTAVGAGSEAMGLVALLFFIGGLLISNSIVTVMTTAGFVSSRQRHAFYITAGLLAAIFSLIVGLVFVMRSTAMLPDLDPYFRWIGGGS